MSALGNKQVMAQNIKMYMEDKGISRKEFCKRLGFAYSTVTDWLNAEKYPRIDKIEMMATFFGVSKADLVEPHTATHSPAKPPAPSQQLRDKGLRIPVLGRVVAGIPIEAIEEVIDWEEIPQRLAASGKFFALRVCGHSMEPRILEGDVVIVRQQEDVESGDIAIVMVNGDEATVKRVKKQEDGITLIATNTSVYEPHFYSNQEIRDLPVRILGKVVELRGKV
ncbi:LexA family protein [Mitsuokella multacida]|uniref:LexA family protein n=1 Tax=Mitsuokella multacida TaxID=52226 RepID=UPI00265EDEDD|nr:LexA family transcriptional regulator [Mitsuokella multacida]